MTSLAPRPRWEVDNNPNLTYPIVTRRGIREMTRAQIQSYAGSIATVDERVADLEEKMARQEVLIETLAATLKMYFQRSCGHPNA